MVSIGEKNVEGEARHRGAIIIKMKGRMTIVLNDSATFNIYTGKYSLCGRSSSQLPLFVQCDGLRMVGHKHIMRPFEGPEDQSMD